MVTLNSGESWIASALVYSGRSNPTWAVSQAVAKALKEIWASLEAGAQESRPGPTLGYQGCLLQGPHNHLWFAFREVVTLTDVGVSESRRDNQRVFESTLLASAPRGILPPSFLDTAMKP
jgi:hypothetical protein